MRCATLPGMTAAATSFVLMTLAELGDKTQILTLCLACRFPARKVLLGVGIAIGVLNLLAVGVGGLAGEMLPVVPVKVGAGLLFLAFGVWSFVTADDGGEETCDPNAGRSATLAVAGAFFLAEFGDKTQLAALSLAARFSSLGPVWIGATAGMLLANGLALGGGTLIGSRLSRARLAQVSGGLFVLFGLLTLGEALL